METFDPRPPNTAHPSNLEWRVVGTVARSMVIPMERHVGVATALHGYKTSITIHGARGGGPIVELEGTVEMSVGRDVKMRCIAEGCWQTSVPRLHGGCVTYEGPSLLGALMGLSAHENGYPVRMVQTGKIGRAVMGVEAVEGGAVLKSALVVFARTLVQVEFDDMRPLDAAEFREYTRLQNERVSTESMAERAYVKGLLEMESRGR